MQTQVGRPRPVVVMPNAPAHRCLRCGARQRSICDVMDDADLAKLARAAIPMRFDRGATFIDEGEPATDFFNLSAGTVKLFKLLPDGRQQVTGFASAGHFLGLAVSQFYAFSAQAIEPVQLCRFSRPKLQLLMTDFPKLEHKLLETACNELATAQGQMLLLGRKTARERVASFLVSMLHEVPCGSDNHIRLPMTRGEIADYLGLTIETVSRTLSRFKADRKVGLPSNDMVVVLDRDWLEELASGAG